MVWVHGGGFLEGSANDARYNGSFIVETSVQMGTPVIFASFNYRLGAFGTVAGSAAEEAGITNLFLHDQRQALRWIQENIAAFGGDDNLSKDKYGRLAETMSRMWVSFAVTHDPNHHKLPYVKDKWPVYSQQDPENMVFEADGVSVQADIWRKEAHEVFLGMRQR
ncbi:alpha/beta-hydrolase [Periconia macrospinosa]|uniref:Alpha/beta-hydrolase n=1 Tax=Periconia macrospinosa TaxID=97972 RepID=A0A2V1E0L2_9PLEO|nr:alpha/beta-hydrolase [Periconia macrospinosa]